MDGRRAGRVLVLEQVDLPVAVVVLLVGPLLAERDDRGGRAALDHGVVLLEVHPEALRHLEERRLAAELALQLVDALLDLVRLDAHEAGDPPR